MDQSRAAAEALRLAHEAAVRGKRTAPSTADIVSGVINLDRGIGVRALTHLGLTRDEVVRHLDNAPPEATYRTQAALTYSRRFAGATMVTTGHLLVGALSDPASAAAQALVNMGIKVDAVRIEVEELFTAGIDDDVLPSRQLPAPLCPSADAHGVALPWALTIADSDRAVVRADSFVAYPTGFEFRLVLRVGPRQRLSAAPWRYTGGGGLELRVEAVPGMQYQMVNPGRLRNAPPACMVVSSAPPPEYAVLSPGRRADYTLWCSPLPPVQMLDIVCNWTEFDIHDARVRVDGVELRAAGSLAVPLWVT